MPLGEPWRAGKRPYGQDTLSVAASGLKGFYLHLAALGINRELGGQLARTRLPARVDRDRALLGHLPGELPANPLAPRRVRRRHPKMLPDGARNRLAQAVSTARDRLVVTWLSDGGFRIGELCGLHLADLHLHENAGCGDCRSPHVHVCHRDGNANRARAKTKYPWSLEDGVIRGGLVRRASPAMVRRRLAACCAGPVTGLGWAGSGRTRSVIFFLLCFRVALEHARMRTYGRHSLPTFSSLLLFAPPETGPHLVRTPRRPGGHRNDTPWLRRRRRVRWPSQGIATRMPPNTATAERRHTFASAVLDASGGNLLVARDAGGWASVTVVDEVYGYADVHDPVFDAALRQVWGEQP